MYLKSLTLRGFKSFASATTLQLEPGITCVVGPNGSGKSNVVDALAWVMGEQGAKSLRGGKMEDVIFAGTSGRPPLGRAEVALTIDNGDGALPIDYTEVTISRTMFRNGGSEYAINGSPCRLLDVQELLSDSGIGREMHVIVGQGQLDSILHATPEDRRGFVEEAAGVLKHRKRKEKALRKLESTDANLTRLQDLLSEIRRQLKPLGRQAEVARKAASVQADVRDARARLLADDLVTARTALEQELADETILLERQAEVEAAIAKGREHEAALEARLRESLPALASAQETWFALSGLRERLRGTGALAGERVRNARDGDEPVVPSGRDPEQLLAEAEQVRAQEREIDVEVDRHRTTLDASLAARQSAEQQHAEEDRRVAGVLRAAADRREGLARLRGQVHVFESRSTAAEEELGRLADAREDAVARAERAQRQFTALESQIAGLDAGEEGLDAEHEAAASALGDLDDRLAKTREEAQTAERERSAAAARCEALELGLSRKDGAGALLAANDSVSGLLGSVAALLNVRNGYETAVAAALGSSADAVAAEHLDAALGAIEHLKSEDLGRAGIVLGAADVDDQTWPGLPDGATYAVDVVECPESLRPALSRLLFKVAVVSDLGAAKSLVAALPDATAVTRDGDLLGVHFAAGGSSLQPSLIEVQAAVDEAEERLTEATHACQRLGFDLSPARGGARAGAASRRRGARAPPRVRRHLGGGRRGARTARASEPVRQGRGGAGDRRHRGGRGGPRPRPRRSRRPREAARRGRGRVGGRSRHRRAGAARRPGPQRPSGRDGGQARAAHGGGTGPRAVRSCRRPGAGRPGGARRACSCDRPSRTTRPRGQGRRGRQHRRRPGARTARGLDRGSIVRASHRGAVAPR